jgi:hypothetical protein
MATGIADEIIPVETPGGDPLLHLSGALEWCRRRPCEWVFLWIRVEGRMTEGVASEFPEVMPLLGAEQSRWPGNTRQTPNVLSEFLTRRKIYQFLSLSLLTLLSFLGFNLGTRNCHVGELW